LSAIRFDIIEGSTLQDTRGARGRVSGRTSVGMIARESLRSCSIDVGSSPRLHRRVVQYVWGSPEWSPLIDIRVQMLYWPRGTGAYSNDYMDKVM
jgi:hypothetical protein